jgi:hypothetical protein
MGIKPKFNADDVAKQLDKLLKLIDSETITALQAVGEKAVSYARHIPPPDQGGLGFVDRTANLRSSIGYAVYRDGHQVVNSSKGTAEGTNQGQALADQVGKQTDGFALVVTAGMYYAVYVESKGRDVLTSAEQRAADWLQVELDDLKKAVIDYWKKL